MAAHTMETRLMTLLAEARETVAASTPGRAGARGIAGVAPLRENEVRVWLANAASFTAAGRDELSQLLTEADQTTLARVTNPAARASRTFTRGLLRAVLLCTHGPEAAGAVLHEGVHGKPFLAGQGGSGRDAARIEFNVSHSTTWASIALSHAGAVGVDVEDGACSVERVLRLAPRVFDAAALAHLDALAGTTDEARVRYFLAQWALREALLKCTGEGLSRDPRTLRVAHGCNEEGGPVVISLQERPALAVSYANPAGFVTLVM